MKALDKIENSIFSVYDTKPIRIVNENKKEETYHADNFEDDFVVIWI